MSITKQEFLDGVDFWKMSTDWPHDFHNARYRQWSDQNPHGDFTQVWWDDFLPILNRWKATRNSRVDVSARFTELAGSLSKAWHVSCEPYLTEEISTVDWDQVKGFPEVVVEIKPLKYPSPVFTSKFCHFLLPRVFPVVDKLGLGSKWAKYETYFTFVQEEWCSTPEDLQGQLVQDLCLLIEEEGEPMFSGFPRTNKIVELCLMGRHHPS